MKQYWPMARTSNSPLFTYDPFSSLDKALAQFAIWDEDFRIKEAWIQVIDGDEKTRINVEKTWKVKEETK